MGIKMVITVDDPQTNLFMVGWQMQASGDGFYPAVSEIQVMPLQLDANLTFRERFLKYDETPGRNQLSQLQQEISQQLLGGGDIFNTLVAAISTLYQTRNISKILGSKGKTVKWLCYHAQEVLDSGETASDVICRAQRMYDTRFGNLGWSENGSFWEHHFDCHDDMLYRALSYRKVDQGRVQPLSIIDLHGESRETKVTLQRYAPLVSEDGLTTVVELLRDMCPQAIPEASACDLSQLRIFQHVRRQENLIAAEHYEAIKAQTAKYQKPQRRRKKQK